MYEAFRYNQLSVLPFFFKKNWEPCPELALNEIQLLLKFLSRTWNYSNYHKKKWKKIWKGLDFFDGLEPPRGEESYGCFKWGHHSGHFNKIQVKSQPIFEVNRSSLTRKHTLLRDTIQHRTHRVLTLTQQPSPFFCPPSVPSPFFSPLSLFFTTPGLLL